MRLDGLYKPDSGLYNIVKNGLAKLNHNERSCLIAMIMTMEKEV